MEISQARVMVTGANRGIGLALAEMFAESKAHLHLVNRTIDSTLEKRLGKLGAASVKISQVDLADRASITDFLEAHAADPVDILVNNAGQLTGGLLENQSVDEIYSMFQVNLTALVQLTRGFLPGMLERGRGKIVNNSSVSGMMYFPCASTYAASKAAVMGFTQSLQAELKGTGVSTLLLFTPGIETRMFKEIPKKYGQHLNLDLGKGIPPSEYAEIVKKSILSDATVYKPSGFERVGFTLAQHSPKIFQKLVGARFKR